MEAFAGVAAVGGLGAKGVFEYNRENFQYDRLQRRRKEMQLMSFKIEQAQLWREDVRDLISLTEYKMHVYLLVNVLTLGFTVVLWCEGRLPETTPDWLMMGHALSISGAFMFLLLSIWLAMHAAVAAQSYETRLLTQLVRLPIPSWDEVEACRTYGCEFEQVEPRQMFRVPFVMGKQEKFVRGQPPPRGQDQEAGDEENPWPSASDPWGLERNGEGIEELGCKLGSDVSKFRHIKLARQAMKHWQSHDAFARISMSIGINQLLLAMSYYILGYILVEVGCRTAATYGVILLTVLAETLTRLDMSLSVWQLRVVQWLLAFGPTMACLAAYHWSRQSPVGLRTAEGLITLSFLSHGLFLAVMTRLCRIKQQDNGTMLPVAFRSVLYLDVFGWLRPSRGGEGEEEGLHRLPSRFGWLESLGRDQPAGQGAHDLPQDHAQYGDEPAPGTPDEQRCPHARPAMEAVAYVGGRPLPRRPEDLASCSVQDLRGVPGAPQPDQPEDHRFYDGSLWMPGKKEDEEVDEEHREDARARVKPPEGPGLLPWRVFCVAMLFLTAAWLLAAIYHLLGAANVWDLDPPILWERNAKLLHTEPATRKLGRGPKLISLRLLGSSAFGGSVPERVEHVALIWPHPNVEPRSLACDADGTHFLASDGLLTFEAQLSTIAGARAAAAGGRAIPALVKGGPTSSSTLRVRTGKQVASAEFFEAPCVGVEGEGLEDVALSCSASGNGTSCAALVLHRHGRRISACPLAQVGLASGSGSHASTKAVSPFSARVADGWLEQRRDNRAVSDAPSGAADDGLASVPHVRVEKVSSVSVGPGCAGGANETAWEHCALLGTTHGRVVKLRRHSRRQDLVPADILREGSSGANSAALSQLPTAPPGAARALHGAYLGVLQPEEHAIQVLDMNKGGAAAGQLKLPHSRSAGPFCAGGGFLYMLDSGPSPQMWRFPLPSELIKGA